MFKTQVQSSKTAILLACFHILIIASSNFLVQIPVSIWGFNTTWGAFTFPFIFLTTDLTVRIFGAPSARKIIFLAMLPALLISYVITVLFREADWMGWHNLLAFHLFEFRIAFASFSAYVIGQLMDVYVFNRLRQNKSWWHAPAAAAVFGNLVDTISFFGLAFYKTDDAYLADHLFEIATVDYAFKLFVNGLFFLPLYKVILDRIMKKLNKQETNSSI